MQICTIVIHSCLVVQFFKYLVSSQQDQYLDWNWTSSVFRLEILGLDGPSVQTGILELAWPSVQTGTGLDHCSHWKIKRI